MPLLFSSGRGGCARPLAKGLLIASLIAMNAPAQDRHAADRDAMLESIARSARETASETGRAAFSPRVMAAVARVPRHRLVPASESVYAYRDRPLPIGQGQTISQPFIVALMTDLLDLREGEKVLEIGTGSGYQAAVLAELGVNVYTIEIVEALGRDAAKRLAAMGYRNIATKIGDGHGGWPEHGPYDAIIMTAAPLEVPPALVAQLKPGGRLVAPLGPQHGAQTLYLLQKQPDGALARRAVLGVRFVPLTGGSPQKP